MKLLAVSCVAFVVVSCGSGDSEAGGAAATQEACELWEQVEIDLAEGGIGSDTEYKSRVREISDAAEGADDEDVAAYSEYLYEAADEAD